MRGSRPNLRAASAAASRCSRETVSNAILTTFALGNTSRAISTRFAASSSWCTKIPVTLPPGCDRLATYPFARGSKSTARNAIGLPSAAESAARSAGSFPTARKHVNFACRELAIVAFVAFDVRCLDVVECKIPAFLIAEFGHPLEEICIMWGLSRLHPDKADTQHLRLLLRARRERPGSSRAAEQSDELASPYVEHGLLPRNPLSQLTAGSGCTGSARRSNRARSF